MLLVLCLIAAPLKIAVPPLQAGEGVQEKTVAALTEAVAAEIRKRGYGQVITQDEIKSLLSFEEQRQIAGCTSDSCIAEIGNALGADRIVQGSVARVGESWLVFLKCFDLKRVVTRGQSDRRFRGGKVDDVLDVLPAMVQEILAGEGPPAPMPPVVPAPAAAPAETSAAPAPSPLQSRPKGDAALAAQLTFFRDGAGHLFAIDPSRSLFFAGGDTELVEQRVGTRSRNGDDWSLSFWDPRFFEGYKRSFGVSAGKPSMRCGDKEIALQTIAPAEAKKLRAKTKLFEPRWQRRAEALALDDTGVYYYADTPRSDDPDSAHLYIGAKGKLRFLAADRVANGARRMYTTPEGTLTLDLEKKTVEWSAGGKKLTFLDVDVKSPLIYGALGVYKDRLFSACDGFAD